MSVFINETIEDGITNYIKLKNNDEIEKVHVFELRIIQALSLIYGEINILNPYKLKKEDTFILNLEIYGMTRLEIKKFISLTSDYSGWLRSSTSMKNNIVSDIKELIMKMLILRNKVKKLDYEEIVFFDNFFTNKEKAMSTLNTIISEDPFYIGKLWKRKKDAYLKEMEIEMKSILPTFLPEEKYQEYGLNKKEVEQLSNLKIEEINEKIEEDDVSSTQDGGRTKPLQLVLTSGSGFADTLVLLSIMATEIMIGLLVAFAIARG